MKRLVEVLNWYSDNKVNIEHISYDNTKECVLIMYDGSNKMLEITDNDCVYYDKKVIKRFSQIRTEEIIKLLNGNL